MPMLVPTNSSGMNQPRTIVIMSNHVQQQQQSQTTPEMSVRPSLMMGNSGFAMQNGTPVMTTNQSSGPTLLRTSSGLIEVKNLRMPMGQRVMITPQGSTIPVQRFPSSDPSEKATLILRLTRSVFHLQSSLDILEWISK